MYLTNVLSNFFKLQKNLGYDSVIKIIYLLKWFSSIDAISSRASSQSQSRALGESVVA